MPLSAEAKTIMLAAAMKKTAPSVNAAYIGLFGSTGQSVEASAAGTKIHKTAHGLSNGNLVAFSALTGGTGLFVADPYWVVESSTNEFALSLVESESAHAFTTEITAGTINKLTELSGGSYVRLATSWAAAGQAKVKDSSEHKIEVPAGSTVSYEGWFTALSAGTVMGINAVTPETFSAAGQYAITSTEVEMLASA